MSIRIQVKDAKFVEFLLKIQTLVAFYNKTNIAYLDHRTHGSKETYYE
jgi:hypothetical protein